MTIFGIVWMILCLWGMLKKNIRYMIMLTLLSMVWQCNNVIEIGSLTCGPQLITSAMFLAKSAFYPVQRNGKIISSALLWLLLLFYIVVNAFVLHEPASGIELYIVQLTVYVLTFIRLSKLKLTVDDHFLNHNIVSITFLLLFVGACQLFVELFNLPKQGLLSIFVYNDSSNQNICYWGKNVVRLYSTFMEPSYCAPLFVGLLFYFMVVNGIFKKKETKYVIVGILAICILLTQSSTAYGALIVLLAVYLAANSNKKSTWLIAGVCVLLFFLLYFGTDILDTVIFDKFESASGRVRHNMNSNALETFKAAPLIGIGYKRCRGSSVIFTLLAEQGLVGASIYILFALQILRHAILKSVSPVVRGSAYIVLAGILSQIIACPDIDLCSFWLAMYIYSVSQANSNRKQTEKEENNEKNRHFNISQGTQLWCGLTNSCAM